MANNVGSLRVSLGLDAAEFTQGLTKAQYQAYKFGETLGGGIRSAATLAAGALAAVGLSAAGAVAGINALIEGAADFQDLAEKTGASAEGLASFGVAAGTAGTQVASIGDAMNKLTKNLTGVDDESKAAGAALAALGLNVADFKKLSPEAQIESISKSLAGFADGPQKAAVAMALLGKSGAELLPFLKALDEQGGRNVILTAQQIAQADEYADKQAKAKAELLQYAQALSTEALPALAAFTGVLSDVAKGLLGADQAMTALGANTSVRTFAEDAGRSLAGLMDYVKQSVAEFRGLTDFVLSSAEALKKVGSLDFAGASKVGVDFRKRYGLEEFKGEADAGKKAAQTFVQAYDAALASAKRTTFANIDPRRVDLGADGRPKNDKPTLSYDGAAKKASGGAGGDTLKKLLDNQLKDYENFIKDEDDLLSARNHMLDLYNGQNMISTADFFAEKHAAQERATAAAIDGYNKEISALEAYKAKASKPTDIEAANGKISDLYEKIEQRIRGAERATVDLGFASTKSAQALQDQLSSVNADILDLTGNLAAAAKIRLDGQYKDLLSRLDVNKNQAGIDEVNRLKALKTAQADIGQQTAEITRITEGLRIEEERINIARQLGATGELESLGQLGAARKSAIAQMEGYVATWEAIAKWSDNKEFIRNAEQGRLALQKLSSVADPLADKFRTLFTDSLGNELADFITGTKSAEDAIKGFSRTVINELSNIAAKNFASSLTSSIFGSGGGSGGGFWSSIFGSIFGKAQGGLVQPGGLYQVNENGPEMLSMGGKSYLMAGGNGAVSPMDGKLSSNAGTMGDVILNITTPAGTAVTKSNQRQQGNNRVLEVMIEQVKGAVANDIAQGGQVATALQGTYGLNRGAGTPRRG